MPAEQLQNPEIAILPYADFQKVLKFGDIVFWKYESEKNKYFRGKPEIISRVDGLVKIYRNFYKIDRVINSVSIASIVKDGEIKFDLNDDERESLFDGINLVAYYHQQNSGRFFPASYDSFTPSFFKLNLDKDSQVISFESRVGLRMLDIRPLIIQAPIHVDIAKITAEKTKPLLDALEALYNISRRQNESGSEEARRIIRSISWYNQSKYADPLISGHVQLVMISTAIETLLDIQPFESKTKQLIMGLQLLLGQNQILKKWAEDFYKSRGNVVHGQRVDNIRFEANTSHVVLGQIVYHYCLRAKLLLMGLWPNDDPIGRFLQKPIEYYLGSNLDRLKKIKQFTLAELKHQEKSFSLLGLALSINDETDPSGSASDYKKAIEHIVKLLLERVAEIKKNPPKEIGSIENFDESIQALEATYESILSGKIELVKTLQGVDSYWGNEPSDIKLQVKDLEFSFAILIRNIYFLLNQLYEMYESRKIYE